MGLKKNKININNIIIYKYNIYNERENFGGTLAPPCHVEDSSIYTYIFLC